MEKNLLPCPICGGEQYKNGRPYINISAPDSVARTTAGIQCLHDGCGLNLWGFESVNAVVKKWNTRPNLTALREENERLRGELEIVKYYANDLEKMITGELK